MSSILESDYNYATYTCTATVAGQATPVDIRFDNDDNLVTLDFKGKGSTVGITAHIDAIDADLAVKNMPLPLDLARVASVATQCAPLAPTKLTGAALRSLSAALRK